MVEFANKYRLSSDVIMNLLFKGTLFILHLTSKFSMSKMLIVVSLWRIKKLFDTITQPLTKYSCISSHKFENVYGLIIGLIDRSLINFFSFKSNWYNYMFLVKPSII